MTDKKVLEWQRSKEGLLFFADVIATWLESKDTAKMYNDVETKLLKKTCSAYHGDVLKAMATNLRKDMLAPIYPVKAVR